MIRRYLLPVAGLLALPLAVWAITIPGTNTTVNTNVTTNTNTQNLSNFNTNAAKANINQAANQTFNQKKDELVAKCKKALSNTKATDTVNASPYLNDTEKQALNKCVNDAKSVVNNYCTDLQSAKNLEELEAATRKYLEQASVSDGAAATCVNAVLVTALQEMADTNALYLDYVQEMKDLYCSSNAALQQLLEKGKKIQTDLQNSINQILADGQVTQADGPAIQTASIHATAKFTTDLLIYETAYTCLVTP